MSNIKDLPSGKGQNDLTPAGITRRSSGRWRLRVNFGLRNLPLDPTVATKPRKKAPTASIQPAQSDEKRGKVGTPPRPAPESLHRPVAPAVALPRERDRHLWTETARPGIYLKPNGTLCNEQGMMVWFDEYTAVEPPPPEAKSVLELLEQTAMNPTLRLETRMRAAVAAAPYIHRKQPIALEGSAGPAIKLDLRTALGTATKAELALLEKLLSRAALT